MKAGLLAVAAGIVGSASASHGRHAAMHKRDGASPAPPAATGPPTYPAFPDPACCKSVVTVTVPYGGLPSVSAMGKPSSSYAPPPKPSTSPAQPVIPLPTPEVAVYPTTGVYTIPAKTVVVTDTTTVCAATTTALTAGPNTYGGVTTVVTTATTVTCPYAVVETSGNAVTTVVKSTTYVCPSAGTYTPVPPTTTNANKPTNLVYPVPTSYAPGTYTHPVQVITVTETDYTFVCPLTISVSPSPAAPTSKPSPQPAPPAESRPAPPASSQPAPQASSQPAPPASSRPAPPASAQPAPPASSQPASAASSPAAQPSSYQPDKPSSGGSTSISTNGKKWAMTYTPYTIAGACKTASEVSHDISVIAGKGFTTVRLYATDCNGLENVGNAAKESGMKIILGVFIKADGIAAARPQIADIVAWGKGGNFGLVSMVVIGNESIFNGYCSAAELAAFIGECKAAFSGAGYTGPCTTTEPLNILEQHGSALCGAIDVVAGNIQPFFNAGIQASDAGSFVADQLRRVGMTCPGKEAYNLECGWPNAGSANGMAVPGIAEQRAAIKDILDKVGEKSVIFSYHNDDWKHPGQFGVEQNFGCSQLF